MTAVNVPEKAPTLAPGIGVTEALQASVYLIKGPTIALTSTSPVELFRVPANTMVHEVLLKVATAFDGTGTPSTLTLGDSDDADRFMDTTAAALTAIGYKSSKQDTQPGSGGHVYSADGLITAAFAAGTSSAGSAETYLLYSNRVNKL